MSPLTMEPSGRRLARVGGLLNRRESAEMVALAANVDVRHPSPPVSRDSGYARCVISVRPRSVPAVLRGVGQAEIGPPIVEHIPVLMVNPHRVIACQSENHSVEADLGNPDSPDTTLDVVPLLASHEWRVSGVNDRDGSVQTDLHLCDASTNGNARGLVPHTPLAGVDCHG